LPSLALAAGLGKLSVLSSLGQPLKAEIEIVSLQRGEGDTLGARLAPSDVFRQANVELNPALLSVKFAVQRRAGGQYVMSLTSAQPLNEPFVDMLVELNWANGRLVREYTFLLDPPEYAGPKRLGTAQAAAPAPAVPMEQEPPAPAEPPPVEAAAAEPAAVIAAVPLGPNVPGQPAPAEPSAAVAPSASGAEPTPSGAQVEVMPVGAQEQPEPAEVGAAPAPAGELVQEPGVKSTYAVVRGDTLSKIAIRNRLEGVTLQQMLVALFRANPDAFVADNMNRLRAGKIVSIPDRDAAEGVAPADARRIVTAQYADFNDYRRSLGVAVASAPAPGGGARQAAGPISPPKEQKPAASKEPPKDELRLSRADDAKRGAKAASAAAADDLAAKDNALKEANARIALLEKNLQDLQKLVEVKSKAATQLQQQAEAAKSAPAAKVEPSKAPEPAKVAPKAPEAAKAPEPAKAAPAAKAAEAAKAPEPAKAPEGAAAAKAPEAPKAPEAAKAPEAPKAPEPPKSEAAKAAPKAAPKKAPAAPQVEVSFIDDLLGDPMILGGAGVSFALLVGYAAFAWRRKRSAQFENSIMSVVPSDADSVLGSVGGRNVDTSSSSIQGDLAPGAGKAGEEIDPIAEADVYMAYGRDAQAEEILKDALAKDSNRQAIRVKLLEIYANRKDTRAFETVASELHAATGGRGADWEKVAALGLSIDPTKALYGGKPASPAAPSQLPPGFNETAQMPAFNPPTTAAPPMETEAPLNIDFDIGASTTAGAAPLPDLDLGIASAPSAGPAAGLDFDLGLGGDRTGGATLAGAAPAAAAAEPALSIDFDLPIGDKPAPAPSAAPAAAPATELAAIDFDLGTQTAGAARTEAPKAPALDLASISLDLGAPGGGNGSGGAPDSRWQEVATKLDLAKAYEEMGDKDGARELLKEVVKEGDTAQQQQAQTMLQALG
jgi:pilus assembly protein FimV